MSATGLIPEEPTSAEALELLKQCRAADVCRKHGFSLALAEAFVTVASAVELDQFMARLSPHYFDVDASKLEPLTDMNSVYRRHIQRCQQVIFKALMEDVNCLSAEQILARMAGAMVAQDVREEFKRVVYERQSHL